MARWLKRKFYGAMVIIGAIMLLFGFYVAKSGRSDQSTSTPPGESSLAADSDVLLDQIFLFESPQKVTVNREATFQFGVDQSVQPESVECQLDKGGWNSCGTVQPDGLLNVVYMVKPGRHIFEYRGLEEGQTEMLQGSYSWRVKG
jgi:hypothetical protein